jgi:hypothetical protein
LGRNAKRGEANLRDPKNRWVSIAPQSGNISISANSVGQGDASSITVERARRDARTMYSREN